MNTVAKVEPREVSHEAKFQEQWTNQEAELALALPPHIPVERFMRVVRTAVAGDIALLHADRRSLFEASMKAAQDGLLPDGRDGALVIFRAKVKEKGKDGQDKDVWINKVQWMPMVGGILKKVRNSGELVTIAAHVVYENDHFEYSLGDDERIDHKPKMLGERGKAIGVYAVAKTKDGGIYREVMSLEQVEKVRGVSRAKDSGPWKDWWDEMAKKTVIRRLSKRLPMSSDLDDLIRRDDDLYDFQGKRAEYEGLHQQLAPTARQRLEASRQAGGMRGAVEGFNRDDAAAEPASGQSINADGQSTLFPSDDPGSASSQAAAEGGEGDGEKGSASTAPSPKLDPEAERALREAKADCQRVFVTLAGNPDKLPGADLNASIENARNVWTGELPTEADFVKRLAANAVLVASGQDKDGKVAKILREAV